MGWMLAIAVGCARPERADPPEPSDPAPTTAPATDPTTPPATTTGTTTSPAPSAPDTSVEGPYPVTVGGGQRKSGTCTRPYSTFWPQDAPTDVAVVLTHGFSRSQDQMADLARHVASWGVPVVTTTLCHSTPFDNDPAQDADDLVALADLVGAGPRLYVGHSAGGLRSVLAAAEDPEAVGVLGLDLVDLNALAADAAPGLAMPVDGLLGEPYSCNDDGNGLPVYQGATDSEALRVTDADHCDFESPTNGLCTSFCGQPNPTFTDPEIRDVITGLTTAWAIWRAGLDPSAAGWWAPGASPHDELLATGAIEEL